MKNKKLLQILCLLIIIQPIFDVTIYFLRETFNYSSFLTSVIRPLIAFVMYLVMLLNNNISKKSKVCSFIYLCIYGLYSVFHLFVIKDYFFLNDTTALVNEIRYLFNLYYYLLVLINFYFLYQISDENDKKKITKSIVYAILIACMMHFISFLTGTSGQTYPYSVTKFGYKGWSISSHYLGHVSLYGMPIVLYAVFEKKYFKGFLKYLIVILTFLSGYALIGTKAPLFGITLILCFYTLIKLIFNFINKEKFNFDILFLVLLSLISIVLFKSTLGYNNFYNQVRVYDSSRQNTAQLDDYIRSEEIKDILQNSINSDPNDLKQNIFEKRLNKTINHFANIDFSVFDNRVVQIKFNSYLRAISPMKDKLFGYGYHTMIECLWVETDILGTFYCFGLVALILIFILPMLYLLLPGVKCLINIKQMTSAKLLMGFCFGLFICVLCFVGYTVMFAQTVFYLILFMIIANDEFKHNDKKEHRDYLFMINDLNVGGAEVGLVDTINELAKTKKVDLVLLHNDGILRNKLSTEVNVYYILDKNNSFLKNKLRHLCYFLGGIFTDILYDQVIPNNYSAEIAYIEGFPANFISHSSNKESVKIASIRVGLKKHKLSSDKIPFGKWIIKNAYNKMDKIYTVSKETTSEFIDKYPSCKHKTFTIYTYFNVKDINLKALEKPLFTFNKNCINFLAVGRFNKQKSYDRLINAFKIVCDNHENVMLHIIGKNDTDEGIVIQKMIKSLHLEDKVILHGVLENPYPYMKNCNALISSSLYEGYPRVINEALCLKTLCIGTNVTGTKEALCDNKGILVEDSVEGLVNGMLKVVDNPNIYKEYEKQINQFDGNKKSFFMQFENICQRKEKMIIYMPKLSYGGMEKSLVNLINYNELDKKYDLDLYLIYKGEKNYLNDLPSSMKVSFATKGKWNVKGKIIAIVNLSIMLAKSFVNKYDISISYAFQHPILTTLTRLSSQNNIVYIHSNLTAGVDPKILKKRLNHCKYEKFKKIICVSQNAKDTLCFLINRKDDVFVINNVIDGKNILDKATETIEDFEFKDNYKYFINISRQEENPKKISRIIESVEKLNQEGYKDYGVILIGDGKDHDLYKKMLEEKSIDNIYMLGHKNNPYKYLAKSSSYILSSLREGYPVVFIESMILNIPIVSTDVSDAKKDLPNHFGIVVENSSLGVYDGMKKFLDEGFNIPKKFDYLKFNQNVIKKTLEVYKK